MKRPVSWIRALASCLILNATAPASVLAQPPSASIPAPQAGQPFSAEQLDALLAPIALYPDELLTQTLMASTFPLDVVAAARWVEDPAHKSLTGDALVKALDAQPWDASVKSLVPIPAVLAMLNANLSWLQQLGYAFATQQADVFASVQRLRRLAEANKSLQSSPQQVVRTETVTREAPAGSGQAPVTEQVIVIEPAQPDVVFVPSYDPGVVYGAWPNPSYPPYYAPPPPGYGFGTALATGLAFAAGAAVIGGLWGWARPAWGGGYANVNVNRYNAINVNRPPVSSARWGAATVGGRPANFPRAPNGPVGTPGRGQVSVPGGAVRPPTGVGRPGGAGGIGGAGRPGGPGGIGGPGGTGRPGGPGGAGGIGGPGGAGGAGRPGGVGGPGGPGRPGGPGGAGNIGGPGGAGGAGRPGGVGGPSGAGRPGGHGGGHGGGQSAVQRPAGGQRPGGAFGDMNSGRQAGQFSQRGAQSRSFAGAGGRGGGGFSGGAARGGGGYSGGGGRGGGGGARGGGGGGGRGGRR